VPFSIWPVSGLMRWLSPCWPPSRAYKHSGIWPVFTHLPLRGQRRNCLKSAPIFPFHLSGYPEQAPSECIRVTAGGRLCQAPRVQHGAGAPFATCATVNAPPPPKRLCYVAQQQSVGGGPHGRVQAHSLKPDAPLLRGGRNRRTKEDVVPSPPAQQSRVFASKNG